MTAIETQPLRGSYRSPSFERARVYDAMRMGVFSCPPETPLHDVARIMASQHVHSVIVGGLHRTGSDDLSWGLLTDRDLIRAVSLNELDRSAGEVAGTEFVTIEADESLARAAQLMAEHDVSHVVVVHKGSGMPRGVVSSLDVAGTFAWGAA